MSSIFDKVQQQVVGDALVEALRAKLPEIIAENAKLRLRRVEWLELQGKPHHQYKIAIGDDQEERPYQADTAAEAIVAFMEERLGLQYEVENNPDYVVLNGRNGVIELPLKYLQDEGVAIALIPLEELMQPGTVFTPGAGAIAGLNKLDKFGCAYGSLAQLQKRARQEVPGKIAVAVGMCGNKLRYLSGGGGVPVFFNADFSGYGCEDNSATFRFPTPVDEGGAPCIIYPANDDHAFITRLDIVSWTDVNCTPVFGL